MIESVLDWIARNLGFAILIGIVLAPIAIALWLVVWAAAVAALSYIIASGYVVITSRFRQSLVSDIHEVALDRCFKPLLIASGWTLGIYQLGLFLNWAVTPAGFHGLTATIGLVGGVIGLVLGVRSLFSGK